MPREKPRSAKDTTIQVRIHPELIDQLDALIEPLDLRLSGEDLARGTPRMTRAGVARLAIYRGVLALEQELMEKAKRPQQKAKQPRPEPVFPEWQKVQETPSHHGEPPTPLRAFSGGQEASHKDWTGERIKALWKSSGMKHKEFATAVGISHSSLSRMMVSPEKKSWQRITEETAGKLDAFVRSLEAGSAPGKEE